MTDMFDVLIVGGGPVGACAGTLLAHGSLRVCIVEPKRPPTPTGNLDSRVVAISRASERILTAAGAWPHISGPRVEAYERMRIWHESTLPAGALVFDAAEVGEPNLGYIIENRLLQAALLDEFTAAGGHLHAAEFQQLHVGADAVSVETSTGTLTAKLVIGADGAKSAVREAVGLTASVSDFNETAI